MRFAYPFGAVLRTFSALRATPRFRGNDDHGILTTDSWPGRSRLTCYGRIATTQPDRVATTGGTLDARRAGTSTDACPSTSITKAPITM